MNLNDRKVGIALLIFSGVVWWEASSYPFTSKVLPLALASLVGILGIPLLFKKQKVKNPLQLRKLLPYSLVMIGTIALMDFVGFFVSLVFLIAGGMIVQQQYNPYKIIINSIAFCLLCYLFFIKFLGLPLPTIWNQ